MENVKLERENDNSKEDLPPAYFDKYYADNSITNLDSNKHGVVSNQESDNGSQGSIFNTDIERQYEYLVKEYPKQAGIYVESAEKIHKNNPQEMSGLALDGLKSMANDRNRNNRQMNIKVL